MALYTNPLPSLRSGYTATALVVALMWFAGACSDSGGSGGDVEDTGAGEVTCQGNADCEGRICQLEICRGCVDDAACAAQVEYGVGATCQDGVCAPCQGQQGCACDGGACDDGLRCDDGVCGECAQGDAGCACFPNDTCAEGLRCAEGTCAPCSVGEEGCACDGEVCGEGLRCDDGRCEECPPGEAGCTCDAGACGAGLRCAEGACEPCAAGEAGCACDEGVCGEGLRCEVDVCVSEACDAGTLDCPCLEGDDAPSCAEGLACGADGLCTECTNEFAGCACDEGACDEGLWCDEDDVCAECTSEIEGCPCDDDDACQGGLVCDGGEVVCRAPRACADAGCAPRQLCQEFEAGLDAACLEACEEGFEYNPGTRRCDEAEEILPNCAAGQEGSILAMCQGLNRACVEDGAGEADCGGCLDFFLEEGGACRAVVRCDALTCAELDRECLAAGAASDARCGGCAGGFEEVEGQSVPLPEANCERGHPNSILDSCDAQSRTCVEEGNSARCGVCVDGFAEDPGTQQCVRRLCIDLDPSCEALGRSCEGEPLAVCGGCLPGLMETDPSDPLSQCIEPITCADRRGDPALACDPELFCIDRDGEDSECATWPCLGADGLPDYTRAYREDAPEDLQCVSCELACGGTEQNPIPGETGRIWPFTLENSNRCICETEPGFYILTEGDSTAKPCDADGDGWMSVAARDALDSGDPALIENARCDLRTIDRVVLENEYRQRLTVLLCDEGLVRETACDPLSCDERGLNCSDCGGGRCDPLSNTCGCVLTRTVDLYETVRNDDQLVLGADGENDAPSYAVGERGRRLRAAEVNPLTKACVSVTGDYNDNRVRDIVEWQGGEPSQDADTNLFIQFSYFVELHESRFERTPGQELGRLHIRERSRCEPGFPVQYDRDLDGGDYWRSCTRNRDADFDSSGDNLLIGHDFAQYSCEQPALSCPLPSPPTQVVPNGVIPPHGLCDEGLTLPPVDGVWRGMGHSSQFKCVSVIEQVPVPDDRAAAAPHQIALDTAGGPAEVAGGDGEGVYQVNRCGVACPIPELIFDRPASDFADISGVVLNGAAVQDGPSLLLTPAAQNMVGTAFLAEPIPVADSTSFSTSFELSMSADIDGGTGLSFIIQNEPEGAAAVGGDGFQMGYAGLDSSVAIEFDTTRNGPERPSEPNGNHVALHLGGDIGALSASGTPEFDMNAALNRVWIDYDGITNTLELFISQGLDKPAAPLLSATVDLTAHVGDRAWFGFGASNGGIFNRHAVERWSLAVDPDPQAVGDPDCSEDCAGGSCAASSIALDGDGALPVVTCEPVPREELQVGEVGFAAVRFEAPEGAIYVRGCIDEYQPSPSNEVSRPWRSLCPGFIDNPAAVSGQGNPSNFGKLICGCNVNYGGVNCDIACPTGQPYIGGTCDADTSNNGYCPVDPELEGRNGFWMCGSWASTSYDTPDQPFFSSPEGWKVTGEVPKDGIERPSFCQSDDCETGFKLR